MYEKRKILIIEDETDLCLILKHYFTSRNQEVILAHNCTDGQSLYELHSPEILLVDNNLPDGQGWEMVPELVQEHENTKVYLISAYENELPLMPDYLNFSVIPKPLSYKRLSAILE